MGVRSLGAERSRYREQDRGCEDQEPDSEPTATVVRRDGVDGSFTVLIVSGLRRVFAAGRRSHLRGLSVRRPLSAGPAHV
jgi:hypothetical protein